MELKRIKKGVEMSPELHRRLKSRSADLGLPLWKAFEQALELWLGSPPKAESVPGSRHNQVIHSQLEELLNSGDVGSAELAKGLILRLHSTLEKAPSRKRLGG